jgi:uncharacterized membrane protein YgcG
MNHRTKKLSIIAVSIGAIACMTVSSMQASPVYVDRGATDAAISAAVIASLTAEFGDRLMDRNVTTFRVPIFKCIGPACARTDKVFEKLCNESVAQSFINSSANALYGSGGSGGSGGGSGDDGRSGGGEGRDVPGPDGGYACVEVPGGPPLCYWQLT